MLRNSFSRILSVINALKETNLEPELKEIAVQNGHVRTIKEMDGVADKAQIKHATSELDKWMQSRAEDNQRLLKDDLIKRQRVLKKALDQYNNYYYFMMCCIVMNAVGIGKIAYLTVMSDLSMKVKFGCLAFEGVGIVEGSIHAYKGKRHFAQMFELINIELTAVNEALESKPLLSPRK